MRNQTLFEDLLISLIFGLELIHLMQKLARLKISLPDYKLKLLLLQFVVSDHLKIHGDIDPSVQLSLKPFLTIQVLFDEYL